MIRAFQQMKFKPPLKLGHAEDQKMLQKDGLPAAGWVSALYRVGEKLLADFIDIPEKIWKLIENKAYKNVSSEIFWNIEIDGTLYRRMLAGVALLGADMPAVTNLAGIQALYRAVTQMDYTGEAESLIFRTYSFNPDQEEREIMSKSESEIKLEYDLKAARDQIAATAEQMKEFKASLDGLKKASDEKDAELPDLK